MCLHQTGSLEEEVSTLYLKPVRFHPEIKKCDKEKYNIPKTVG